MSLRGGIGFKADRAHIDLLTSNRWIVPAAIIAGLAILTGGSRKAPALEREHGFALYEYSGQLMPSKLQVGKIRSVTVPVAEKLPPGMKLAAIVHTHPNGKNLELSEADKKVGEKFGCQMIITDGFKTGSNVRLHPMGNTPLDLKKVPWPDGLAVGV